jgi:uncharacterized membrane protein YbhN (UPF0104 family)
VASLPLLILLLQLGSFAILPAALAFSRHMEHEADRFALELTQDGRAAALAFVKLQQSNLSHPRPGPLFVGSALAFLAGGLGCGSLYAIVHGFDGVTMSWDGATFTYSASTLAGAIAMMPGGLGVTEIGMTALIQARGSSTTRVPDRPASAHASAHSESGRTTWLTSSLPSEARSSTEPRAAAR